MATARKGLRRILIDGAAYGWRIRGKPTYRQLNGHGRLLEAVQLAEEPGSVLVIHTDRPHPADWGCDEVIPLTPVDIAGWVGRRLESGETPPRGGRGLRLTFAGLRWSATESAAWPP